MSKFTCKGAAATGHQLTTQAALDTIAAGGNAFDGAIAAAFMACVCEPVLASPGGGGFAMTHTGKSTGLVDFFAQTPISQNPSRLDFCEVVADFGTAKQVFHIGQASSATPGFIPGLFALHAKHATLPMSDLVAPACRAARQGVKITAFQHYLSTVVSPILLHSRQSRAIFAPDGHLHQPGTIFCNPALADFLEIIANKGPSAFPVDAVLSDQKQSGHLRQDDFDNYRVCDRASLAIRVAGSTIHLNPSPAAGGILVALAFKYLDGKEAVDIANALNLTDINRRKANTRLDTLMATLGPPAYRGTSHISVVDRQQNACAMTLSNGEGNGFIVKDCGFMLNNMLGEADINPAGKRGWPLNVRMSSMMCPTIVENTDGSILALGSGGSNRIRSAIFQVLTNLLVRNRDIAESVIHPRLHVEDGHLDFELPGNLETARLLQKTFSDHRQWPQHNMFFGGCHVVGFGADKTFHGIGDPRRHGFYDVVQE